MQKLRLAAVLTAAALVATVVAAATARGGATAAVPDKLVIAYQPGMGYAPLIIMKNQRTLERRYPGMQIEWRVLPSGTAVGCSGRKSDYAVTSRRANTVPAMVAAIRR